LAVLCPSARNSAPRRLLSAMAQPSDPAAQPGVIGRNYCYQTGTGATLFFDDRRFNPFMASGGTNVTFDDFNVNWAFDRGPHGFVGGYNVSSAHNTGAPISYRPLPRGAPQWGTEWKKARVKWYQGAMNIGASG